MLVATFGPSTAWVGKTITREGDAFMLEGHGVITAADVMDYDRQGHLIWTNDGMRAWVGSQASKLPNAATATPQATATAPTSSPAVTTMVAERTPLRSRFSPLSLAVAAGAIAVVVLVLVLAISGVFTGKSQPAGVPSQSNIAPATAQPTAAAPSASWPTRLAGVWVSPTRTLQIAESGGQATITLATTDNFQLTYTFTDASVEGVNPAPGHATDGPYGLTKAGSQPYTGTYVWDAVNFSGSPVITMRVSFADDALTIDTSSYQGSGRKVYALSPDGKTLTVTEGSYTTVYSRQ